MPLGVPEVDLLTSVQMPMFELHVLRSSLPHLTLASSGLDGMFCKEGLGDGGLADSHPLLRWCAWLLMST